VGQKIGNFFQYGIDRFEIYRAETDPVLRAKKLEALRLAYQGSVKALSSLANMCRDSGDNKNAITFYKRMISKEDQNLAAACNNLGNLFLKQENYREAQPLYRRAVDLGLTVAMKNMGILHQEQGYFDTAIDWYRLAASQGDMQAAARLNKLLLRPKPQLISTWQAAEEMAQRWMFYFGYRDAVLSQVGADGGRDVISKRAVAQVKYENKPSGISVIQRHAGIAHNDDKAGLFFSLSGYAKPAIEWANESRVGIALFSYDTMGNVIPVNKAAQQHFNDAIM
jgi:tetratricopeptide (TPR) repeat protein